MTRATNTFSTGQTLDLNASSAPAAARSPRTETALRRASTGRSPTRPIKSVQRSGSPPTSSISIAAISVVVCVRSSGATRSLSVTSRCEGLQSRYCGSAPGVWTLWCRGSIDSISGQATLEWDCRSIWTALSRTSASADVYGIHGHMTDARVASGRFEYRPPGSMEASRARTSVAASRWSGDHAMTSSAFRIRRCGDKPEESKK